MTKPLFDINEHHVANLRDVCPLVPAGIVSKPLLNTESIKQIIFVMDEGQEMSEHHAPFIATVQVIDGELAFSVAGHTHTLKQHDWLVMPRDAPHALLAHQPTWFLLTLVRERVE